MIIGDYHGVIVFDETDNFINFKCNFLILILIEFIVLSIIF